ncbi:MAG TPA: lipoyl(octanoyl) transferase LipB [Thermodesulfobacteriota bacterium]|nr:lipoyl(octanoyl) transferase LipB [Thermodesulfobacteriota bacterium]
MEDGDRSFLFLDLGIVEYERAFELQKSCVEARSQEKIQDILLLLEHLPVFTLSRSTEPDHILVPISNLVERGISVSKTNRGGDVTYHGPGQLVGYVIMDLRKRGKDLHRYVRDLEQIIIDTLADWGISANRIPEHPGVWVHNEKIAAIGIAVNRQWITMHGFSLNIDPCLEHFSLIVPCGIRDRGVTSMKRILGEDVDPQKLQQDIINNFQRVFGTRGVRVQPGELLC